MMDMLVGVSRKRGVHRYLCPEEFLAPHHSVALINGFPKLCPVGHKPAD
jgi:hypothetical protein